MSQKICSDNKKIKTIFLTRKLLEIDNCFCIINSANKELIHHIHCIGYIFRHHNKTMKFCWCHKSLFCDIYFKFYFLMSQRFIIQQEIFMFVITYCGNNISVHVLCFFMLIIVIYQKLVHLWLQSDKFFNHKTAAFIFYFFKD